MARDDDNGRAHNLPCDAFVLAYPYPAWILPARPAAGRAAPSLEPLLMNDPLRQLLDLRGSSEDGAAFLDALGGARTAQALAEWTAGRDAGHLLVLKHEDGGEVRLEATKTHVGEHWVCTTVPRDALPTPSGEPALKRKMGPSRIGDFLAASPSALTLGRTKGGMKERIDKHDWSKTALGPRSAWREGTEAVLSYVLNNPYPVCLRLVVAWSLIYAPDQTAIWWGTELTVMFNDAYTALSGALYCSSIPVI